MYRLIKITKIFMVFPVLMLGMQARVGRSQAEDVYQEPDFLRSPAQIFSRASIGNLMGITS